MRLYTKCSERELHKEKVLHSGAWREGAKDTSFVPMMALATPIYLYFEGVSTQRIATR